MLRGWLKLILRDRFDSLSVQSESSSLTDANVLWMALRVNDQRDQADRLERLQMPLLVHPARFV